MFTEFVAIPFCTEFLTSFPVPAAAIVFDAVVAAATPPPAGSINPVARVPTPIAIPEVLATSLPKFSGTSVSLCICC